MTEISTITRPKPKIVEMKQDGKWKDIRSRLEIRPSFFESFLLKLRPWKGVFAPKGFKCFIHSSGNPIYQYKELNNKTFYLSPAPGPGFLGGF